MNSNDIIKNDFLREEFEVYSKINSEEDREAYMKWSAERYNNLSEVEQEEIRKAWTGNLARISEAVGELGQKVELTNEDIEQSRTTEISA